METPRTIDIMRTYAAAWAAGEVATIFALYHDDFMLHYPGANRLSGTYRGKESALAAMRDFSAVTKRKLVEIADVMAGAHRAVIIARERFEVMEDPPIVERLAVYRLEAGSVRECWMYDSDQSLIDRLIGR